MPATLPPTELYEAKSGLAAGHNRANAPIRLPIYAGTGLSFSTWIRKHCSQNAQYLVSHREQFIFVSIQDSSARI